MMERIIEEESPRLKARVAGFSYLLIIVGALFDPFAVVPSGMMRGHAALPTAAQILASKKWSVYSRRRRATDPGCVRYRRGADLLSTV